MSGPKKGIDREGYKGSFLRVVIKKGGGGVHVTDDEMKMNG